MEGQPAGRISSAPQPRAFQRQEAGIIPSGPLKIGIPKGALGRKLPERKRSGPHGTYPIDNPAPDPCLKEARCKLFISGSNIDLIQHSKELEAAKRETLKKEGAPVTHAPAPHMTAFLRTQTPRASPFIREVLVDPAIVPGAGASAWSGPCDDDKKATCVTVSPSWEAEARTFNTVPTATSIGEKDSKPLTREEWRFRTRQMLTHEAAHARFEQAPPPGMPKFDGTLTRETVSHKELSELFAQLSEFPLFYEEGMSGNAAPDQKLGRVRRLYSDRYLQRTMEITEDIPGILLRLRCLNPCGEVDKMLKSVLTAVTAGWDAPVRQAVTTILTDPALQLHWPAPPQPHWKLTPEPAGLRFGENPLQRKERCETKRTIGKSNDPLEEEADRIAGGVGEVPPIVHDVLRSPGQPLEESTRVFTEARFGHDFSQVRVHRDAKAAESAQAVNALAYTVGHDVVFGAGQYQPGTSAGKRLLAHELTHVIQQSSPLRGSTSALQRKPAPGLSTKVIAHSVSADAVELAQKRMNEVLGSLKDSEAGELKGKTVELHLIPHDKKLTDLSEFASLKGKKTFDGRNYDELRGVGATKVGETIRYAIAEEQLVAIKGKPAGYQLGFVAAHESGHVVEQFGLSKDQKKALQQAYDARKSAKGPWLNPEGYTSSGAGEYFAQSTAAYFGRPYSSSEADKKTYTRLWLTKNDAAMAKLLASVYT
jgi:hypothetical protein